jgi:hypothetical protein
MVFNASGFIVVVLLGILIWLGTVTFLLLKMIRHYNRIGGDGKTGLREVLETIVGAIGRVERKTLEGDKKIDHLMADGTLHIQRIGIIRFNPFADTGGAQSFTIALLDGKSSGIVMTSLYARNSNRWYVKEIIDGKGKELALSKEEQQAIDKAMRGGGIYE